MEFVIFLMLMAGSCQAITDGCYGVDCRNNGTLSYHDNQCHCQCAPGFSGLQCEYELMESQWPRGPYAVPMTTHGCPETIAHGWLPGYISFLFKTKFSEFEPDSTCHGNQKLANKTSQFTEDGPNTSNATVDHSTTNASTDVNSSQDNANGPNGASVDYSLGPVDDFHLQFNFCYKSAGHLWNTGDDWMPGNYSVYGTIDSCPSGFMAEEVTMCLPEIHHWNSDGNIPHFHIIQDDGATYVVLKFCKHLEFEEGTGNQTSAQPGTSYRNSSTPFMLIQNADTACPDLVDYTTTEQGFAYPVYVSTSDSYAPYSLCLFKPNLEPTPPNIEECANIPLMLLLNEEPRCKESTTGEKEADCDYQQGALLFDIGQTVAFAGFYLYIWDVLEAAKLSAAGANIQTDIISLEDMMEALSGDSIAKSHEEFNSIRIRFFNAIDVTWFQRLQIDVLVGAYDARDFETNTTTPCRSNTSYENNYNDIHIHLTCDRSVKGRYVRVLYSFATEWSEEFTSFISKQLEHYFRLSAVACPTNDAESCLRNVGMDKEILDYQLSASSSGLGSNPYMARPHLAGWCAALDDLSPFFQVDLLSITTIDGLIIHNWEQRTQSIDSSGYQVTVMWGGTLEFSIQYGTSLQAMIWYSEQNFRLDVLKSFNEAQTVPFLRSFLARFIRIYPSRVSNEAPTCLRFELLGCKKSGIHSIDCDADVSRELFPTHSMRVSASRDYDTVLENTTVTSCRDQCLSGDYNCIGIEHSASREECKLYFNNGEKFYTEIQRRDTEFDTLETLTCWKDAFTSNVNRTVEVAFSESMIIASPEFPYESASNVQFSWKVTLVTDGFIRVQFTQISLTLNNRSLFVGESCRDEIEVASPAKTLDVINSDLNGFKPTVVSSSRQMMITFRTCTRPPWTAASGDVSYTFRAYLLRDDIPSCTNAVPSPQPVSESAACGPGLVHSNAFLGKPMGTFTYHWLLKPDSSTHFGIVLELMDFDISCDEGGYLEFVQWSKLNGALQVDWQAYEKLKMFRGAAGEWRRFCNGNRPFEELYILLHSVQIMFHLPTELQTVFMQHFRLEYRTLAQSDTIYRNVTASNVFAEMADGKPIVETSVCSATYNKCYTIYYERSESWLQAAEMCVSKGYQLVTIGSLDEMRMLTTVFLQNRRFTYKRQLLVEIHIGLSRYRDSTGNLNDVWMYGRRLTFAAWANDNARDDSDAECSKMVIDDYLSNNTWHTQSCVHSDPDATVNFICEQRNDTQDKDSQSLIGAISFLENNTGPVTMEMSSLFACDNGEYVSILSVCNQMPECADGSDELNCPYAPDTKHMFSCGDGRFVHISSVCDFTVDCGDASDEYCDHPVCAGEGEYTCTNGQCIQLQQHCDGTHDCKDGSDEQNCDAAPLDSTIIYYTCDDVLRSGIRTSGRYKVGVFQHIECDFSNLDNGGKVVMKFLNVDWSISSELFFAGSLTFKLNSAQISHGSEYLGYLCSQSIQPILRNSEEVVSQLHNLTASHMPAATMYLGNFGPQSIQTMYVTPVGSGPLSNIFVEKTLDTKKYRISLSPIVCKKNMAKAPEDLFACGSNLKPIPGRLRCVYELGGDGTLNGCGNHTQLQDCETFECDTGYVKCPNSYCIPASYICNGRMDCPTGSDEIDCWCSGDSTQVVIATYGDNPIHNQQAFRLAGRFTSDVNNVYVINVVTDTAVASRFSVNVHDVIYPSEHLLKFYNKTELGMEDIHTLFDDILGLTDGRNIGFISINPTDSYVQTEAKIVSKLQRMFYSTSGHVYRLFIDETAETLSTNVPFTMSRVTVNISLSDVIVPGNITQIQVSIPDGLATNGQKLFPEICHAPATARCEGGYACSYSTVCLPLANICDGHSQCPFADDERLCDFNCPEMCFCEGFSAVCNNAAFTWERLQLFPTSIRSVNVAGNTALRDSVMHINTTFAYLVDLNASMTGIKDIAPDTMGRVNNLLTLDISYNDITSLKTDVFSDLRHLKNIYLEGNRYLVTIESGAFNGLNVKHISLRHCGILELNQWTFVGLNLAVLDLSFNNIAAIDDYAFGGLTVASIDVSANPIMTFGKNIFKGVTDLKKLNTPAYKYCCVRPSYLNEESCQPFKDEFSTCKDLMHSSVLQALLWVIGLFAVLGNIASLVFRLVYDRARLKLGFGIFVTNLACADLLMGIYLLIIATADTLSRNRYIEVDEYWRSSWMCQFCGIISTMSSEASILFLSLITLDRMLVIKYPFGQIRFTGKSAMKTAAACWLLVLIIAVIPVQYSDYFQDTFYSSRAVCIALPLTRDRPPGWLYSILIFIGFNILAFLLMACGQWLIYLELAKAYKMKQKMNANRSNDLTVTRNLFLVVSTDFMCWFPICCTGILAMAGHPIPSEMYAWTVVLILPINSALNPFMYTFSVLIARSKLNPSTEEQMRSDTSSEASAAVLSIFPSYLSCAANSRKHSCVTLRRRLTQTSLTNGQKAQIALQLTQYLELLHGVDLTVGPFDSSNVLMYIDNTGQLVNHGTLLYKKPLPCSKAVVKATDMYSLGLLLRGLLLPRKQ